MKWVRRLGAELPVLERRYFRGVAWWLSDVPETARQSMLEQVRDHLLDRPAASEPSDLTWKLGEPQEYAQSIRADASYQFEPPLASIAAAPTAIDPKNPFPPDREIFQYDGSHRLLLEYQLVTDRPIRVDEIRLPGAGRYAPVRVIEVDWRPSGTYIDRPGRAPPPARSTAPGNRVWSNRGSTASGYDSGSGSTIVSTCSRRAPSATTNSGFDTTRSVVNEPR